MNRDDTRDELDIRVEDLLRYVLAIGAVLVLLLPAARGFSPTLGWLPLWLLLMPLAAWGAVRGGRRPPRDIAARALPRRRRLGAQARRRPHVAPRRTASHVA